MKKKQIELNDLESKYKKTKIIIGKFKNLQTELSQFIHSRSASTSEQLMQQITYPMGGNPGDLQLVENAKTYNTTPQNNNPEGLQQLDNQEPYQPSLTGILITENEQGGMLEQEPPLDYDSQQEKEESKEILFQNTNTNTDAEFFKKILKLDGRKTIADPISNGDLNPFLMSLQNEDSPIPSDEDLSNTIRNGEIHVSQLYTPNIKKQSPVSVLLAKEYHKSIEAMMPSIYKSIADILDKHGQGEFLGGTEIAKLRNCCSCFNEITKSNNLPHYLKDHSIIKSFNLGAKKQSERIIKDFDDKCEKSVKLQRRATSRSKSPRKNVAI